MSDVLTHTSEITKLAKEVIEIESQAVLRLADRIGASFDEAVKILYACKGRIIVTGMGKSGLVGKKIAATLSSTGTPSYFLHPAESTHGDSGIITREDAVIALSNSGETAELLNLLPLIKRFGIPLIALTGKMESTLGQKSDVALDISVEKEACPLNKAPTASTTATLAMGDALAVCLLKKRGFSEEDFLIFHPSGSLGKGILYSVEELMIKGENLPVVKDDDDFVRTIETINQKRLGCAIVVNGKNEMVGILTDGDIRRILLNGADIKSLKTKEVMTVSPKTIKPTDLAAKALQIMEKYSITSIVVCDSAQKPVGLIHVHDLLKAGVV